MSSFAATFSLGFIFFAFATVLTFYGDCWLVPWHDEVVIVRISQNLAEGRGFRNDLIDDLLFGADEKTYWQMPLYPFALSLWGKIFGFELNSVRSFSRVAGTVSLFLLILLCRNLNLPFGATLLALLWTASDLTFQFSSNFARPDALTGCLLLLTALLLSNRLNGSFKGSVLIGLVASSAVFNHPIALPCWLVSGAIVVKRAGWRNGLAFCLPFLVFTLLWLCYVLSGWEIFIAQVKAHMAHKRYSFPDFLTFLLGFTAWGVKFFIDVPLNAMPWLVPIVLTIYIGFREKWLLPKWFVVFSTVMYAAVMIGAEAWYPSLFVPLGFLTLSAIANHLKQMAYKKAWHWAIVASVLLLWFYQVFVIARHLYTVPKIRLQLAAFVSELKQMLPSKAKVLVGSFSPDPTFALMAHRPDITLYTLMPSRMLNDDALRRLRTKLTHLLVLKEAKKEAKFEPLIRGKEIKRWEFDFGGLSRSKKIVIVLLVNKERHKTLYEQNDEKT